MFDAIKGIERVVKQHQSNIVASKKPINQDVFEGSVALLNPIAGDGSHFWSLRLALDAATCAGVHVVVAAPSINKNECSESIAPVNSICNGASTLIDGKAFFANFVPCLDLLAPGDKVLSTFVGPAEMTLSGTGVAAAHIAGFVVYLLSQ